jgi:cellobiose phosphorylase
MHSLRHGPDLLLNLVFGCPLAGGLQRLYVEIGAGESRVVVPVIGPGSPACFAVGEDQVSWTSDCAGTQIEAVLMVGPGAWALDVSVGNKRAEAIEWRAFHGIDVGLTAPGAARNNESYTSQYIDHRALEHPEYGIVVASRQNLAVDGEHPFLLHACLGGCDDFATDARDVFGGPIERSEMLPPCLRDGGAVLPGVRQGESGHVALRSRSLGLGAGESGSCRFVGLFVADHQAPSSDADLQLLDSLGDLEAAAGSGGAGTAVPGSIFDQPRVVHGEEPGEEELRRMFPGDWDCVERSADGALWSFFTGGDARHVVTRAKESVTARPHATILRSGGGDYPRSDQLTTTCFAAGVFNSLLSSGHTSFHRLLSYPRESCGLIATAGQRIWLRDDAGGWNLLGVPSFFEMGLSHARWHYLLPGRSVEVEVLVDRKGSGCRLDLRVLEGEAAEFLVSHGLIGGINEYDAPAAIEIERESASARVIAAADNPWCELDPGAVFVVRADDPEHVCEIGGADLLEGGSADHAMLVFRTRPLHSFAIGIAAESGYEGDLEEDGCDWMKCASDLRLRGDGETAVRLGRALPWFVHNGMIHFTVPHGVEQYNGGAWGSRDVTQGSVELLLALGRTKSCRRIVLDTYRHQYEDGHHWPQWFMLEPFGHIQQSHSHGDIPLWPIKALCDYLEASSDFAILDEPVAWTRIADGTLTAHASPLFDHLAANLDWLRRNCVPGTALLSYGDGDWNDSLQPAQPELKERLVSSWSVALCYQVLRRLEELCDRSGRDLPGLAGFADEVSRDFHRLLVIDGTVCGFFLFDEGSSESGKPLLHPADERTGIRYRLLPMTRSMIGGLFTAEEAEHHHRLIDEHLLAADGARLMDRPPAYRGGTSGIFQRAESSPCFSREIGLFYSHAHLRYIEAMARLGRAEAMLEGFGKVNPVAISASVPHSLPRQANAYFSSSDAVVATRYEAAGCYDDIKAGRVPVDGGWRIYSSGPGIFVNLVITRMVGLRRHYDQVVVDPVVPRSLDGLEVDLPWGNKSLRVVFSVKQGEHTPRQVILNGEALSPAGMSKNPYRDGGWLIDARRFDGLLRDDANRLEIEL